MAKLARHVFATLVTLLFVFLWLSAGDRDPVGSWLALGAKLNEARVAMGAVSGPARLHAAAPAVRPAPLTRRLASLVP
jgi:hypothetical protein